MLIVERQHRVIEILKQRKTAQLDELARALDVSASTIRRDLEQLEAKGVVQRTHGGAIYRELETKRVSTDALAERMDERTAEKRAIAEMAATLVEPNMTLLLDGGSTVIYTVRRITARPLQVVTNSLAVANEFAEDEQVELTLIGGRLYPRSGVLVGPIATGSLAELGADLLFFSVAAIYDDTAFNQNMDMAVVEQVMLQQAARSVLLTDSSKFGRKSLVRVCGLSEVNHIISDAGVPNEWRSHLGDQLMVAGD